MSNNPGLDLDHHVPLIGSCSLVTHHVPQHILQSVGSIYNLEGCYIAGYTLKEWHPSRLSIHWTDSLLLVTVTGKPAQKTVTIGGYWRAHLWEYILLCDILPDCILSQQIAKYVGEHGEWLVSKILSMKQVQTMVIWHGQVESGIGTEVIGCITGEQIWILKSGTRLNRWNI